MLFRNTFINYKRIVFINNYYGWDWRNNNEVVDKLDNNNSEIDEKRESLSILLSMGTKKDFLGVEMTLGDIKNMIMLKIL